MAQPPQYFVWMSSAQLAEAVITTRQATGLTQVELAGRAAVGRKFVWQLEQGKATLRADKVLAVLRVLGLVPLLILPTAVLWEPA